MSGDAPTVPFNQPAGQPGPPSGGVPAGNGAPEKKSRRTLILILILAALVVIAIVVIILLLMNKTAGTTAAPNTTSPTLTAITPTPTQSTVATPTPSTSHTQAAPPVTGLHFTNYSISPLQVDCSTTAPASAQYLTITWTSINGSEAFFGVNTTDAQANGMGWDLPPSGTNHNFPSGNDPYSYLCSNASQTYTITIVGPGGAKQSKTITVTRK
jgi:flagellar basal body-associated protein FliL